MTFPEARAVLEPLGVDTDRMTSVYDRIVVVSTEPSVGERLDYHRNVSFKFSAVYAKRVIDGDTVRLSTGDTLRLIGLDAPELGTCEGKRARRFLVDEIADGRVYVGNPPEVEDRDRHGRLLAYLSTDTINDLGYQLIIKGHAVPRYNSIDGYGEHESEEIYQRGASEATRYRCAKPVKKVPQPQSPSFAPDDGPWVCTYSPTYDRDWHNDVVCSDGSSTHRPYFRPSDTYITPSEIMAAAREYQDRLNR